MIEKALVFVVGQLNRYLRNRLGIDEDKVILSYLVGQDGAMAVQEIDKVILTLVDVSQDSVIRNGSWVHSNGGTTTVSNPAVNINLYLVFTAYFDPTNYRDALRFISLVVSFFQQYKVFDQSQYAELAQGEDPIERLIFELYKSNFQELSHLWGMLGAKHMPHTIYYMRMLTYQGDNATAIIPPLRGPDSSTNPPQ